MIQDVIFGYMLQIVHLRKPITNRIHAKNRPHSGKILLLDIGFNIFFFVILNLSLFYYKKGHNTYLEFLENLHYLLTFFLHNYNLLYFIYYKNLKVN